MLCPGWRLEGGAVGLIAVMFMMFMLCSGDGRQRRSAAVRGLQLAGEIGSDQAAG